MAMRITFAEVEYNVCFEDISYLAALPKAELAEAEYTWELEPLGDIEGATTTIYSTTIAGSRVTVMCPDGLDAFREMLQR